MSSKSVIVIGGGLAGLSCAVALAEAGFRVRLLEQRPFLGGRAASYDLPGGEHVSTIASTVTLGCCTNLTTISTTASVPGEKSRSMIGCCLPIRPVVAPYYKLRLCLRPFISRFLWPCTRS